MKKNAFKVNFGHGSLIDKYINIISRVIFEILEFLKSCTECPPKKNVGIKHTDYGDVSYGYGDIPYSRSIPDIKYTISAAPQ